MELLILWIAIWLVGAYLGQRRGRTAAGFWWAFILGPIGWLILLLGPNPKKASEEAAKRDQEQRLEALQHQHLAELRALRATMAGAPPPPAIEEVEYLIRQGGKVRGPIAKAQLLELLAARKIDADTEIAPAASPTAWRALHSDIPFAVRN